MTRTFPHQIPPLFQGGTNQPPLVSSHVTLPLSLSSSLAYSPIRSKMLSTEPWMLAFSRIMR
jgi:hypothetical protein